MQVRIVTLEREYGSGGAMIAKNLAKSLGWKLWDEELTAEIARLAKVDRKSSGAVRRTARSACVSIVQGLCARKLRENASD